jgi:hypothetical protein
MVATAAHRIEVTMSSLYSAAPPAGPPLLALGRKVMVPMDGKDRVDR